MMKTLFFFILVSFLNQIGYAQPDFQKTINALKNSDVAQIVQQLDEKTEMVIDDVDGTYSRTQALSNLKQFFDQNQAKNCSLIHSGAARDGESFYCIASLKGSVGTYRVYVFYKKNNDQYLIQELRIEAE